MMMSMEEMPSPSPNSDEDSQPSTQPDGGGTGGAGDTGVSIQDFLSNSLIFVNSMSILFPFRRSLSILFIFVY